MRLKLCLALVTALMLSGCLSPEEEAARDQRRAATETQQCVGLGAVTQDQIFWCRMRLRDQRLAAERATGAALQAVGQTLMNPPRQQPRRMVTTNCHTFMNTVTCNTM